MDKKEKIKRNKTVKYNLINSAIAGGLFFCGSISNGSVSWQSTVIAFAAGLAVFLKNFKDYWEERGKTKIPKGPRMIGLFHFI